MNYRMIARLQWLRKIFFRPVISGTHEDKSFVLDHLHIENATLINCELIYGGGQLKMINTHMDGCADLVTFGKGANFLQFLQQFDSPTNTVLQRTFPYTFRQSLQASGAGTGIGK